VAARGTRRIRGVLFRYRDPVKNAREMASLPPRHVRQMAKKAQTEETLGIDNDT
jgi:hypothetical protein